MRCCHTICAELQRSRYIRLCCCFPGVSVFEPFVAIFVSLWFRWISQGFRIYNAMAAARFKRCRVVRFRVAVLRSFLLVWAHLGSQ